MTPEQWARVLRAGRDRASSWATRATPQGVLVQALDAMAAEAEQIAQETR